MMVLKISSGLPEVGRKLDALMQEHLQRRGALATADPSQGC